MHSPTVAKGSTRYPVPQGHGNSHELQFVRNGYLLFLFLMQEYAQNMPKLLNQSGGIVVWHREMIMKQSAPVVSQSAVEQVKLNHPLIRAVTFGGYSYDGSWRSNGGHGDGPAPFNPAMSRLM